MRPDRFTRGLGALLLAQLGGPLLAQEAAPANERRVRIEITRNDNGKTSHVTREFDLNNDAELHEALRELGVIDELGSLEQGEDLVLDLRRSCEGGLLNDMSLALTMPAIPSMADERAYLGVEFTDVTKDDRRSTPDGRGARITRVEPDTPAETAGLREGDAVVAIGRATITKGSDLADAVAQLAPGEQVKVTYYRNGKKNSCTATLGRRDRFRPSFPMDMSFDDLVPELELERLMADEMAPRAFLGVIGGSTDDDSPGIRVGEVVEGSAAEAMGLEVDDVILRIDDRPVGTFGELAAIIRDKMPDDTVRIDLLRDGVEMSSEGTLGLRSPFDPGMPPAMHDMPPMPAMPHFDGMAPTFRDQLRRNMDEQRREMEELRREMGRLRQELRGEVTRELRVSIDATDLAPEEQALLKKKGVNGLDQSLELDGFRCTRAGNGFRLQFQAPVKGDLTVDLHNADGARVYHETVSAFKGAYERLIDLQELTNGTYYLVVHQGGKTRAKKLVKR